MRKLKNRVMELEFEKKMLVSVLEETRRRLIRFEKTTSEIDHALKLWGKEDPKP